MLIDASQVLCGCANLTYTMFRQLLDSEPGLSFAEALRRTGSGGTCTACLLDLEFHYADIQGRSARRGRLFEAPPGAVAKTSRRALYRLLDRLSPLVPYRKQTWSPVILGAEIDHWLWVANHRLLYGTTKTGGTPSPLRVGLVLYDARGRVRLRSSYRVDVEEVLRVNVSEPLKQDGHSWKGPEGLGVGTARLRITPLRPGMWGTTRPQFEIVTPRATCAVHTQAPGAADSHWFTCLFRPEFERLFSVVTNPGARALRVWRSCAAGSHEGSGPTVSADEVTLPPHGAWIGEERLPETQDWLPSSVMRLNWRISGRHKLHLLCASPKLDRFSIDHL